MKQVRTHRIYNYRSIIVTDALFATRVSLFQLHVTSTVFVSDNDGENTPVAESIPAGSDQPWLRWRSMKPPAHWDWPWKDNDEDVGLHWQHTVSQLPLCQTTNNGPTPLLSVNWWALLPAVLTTITEWAKDVTGRGNTLGEGHESKTR